LACCLYILPCIPLLAAMHDHSSSKGLSCLFPIALTTLGLLLGTLFFHSNALVAAPFPSTPHEEPRGEGKFPLSLQGSFQLHGTIIGRTLQHFEDKLQKDDDPLMRALRESRNEQLDFINQMKTADIILSGMISDGAKVTHEALQLLLTMSCVYHVTIHVLLQSNPDIFSYLYELAKIQTHPQESDCASLYIETQPERLSEIPNRIDRLKEAREHQRVAVKTMLSQDANLENTVITMVDLDLVEFPLPSKVVKHALEIARDSTSPDVLCAAGVERTSDEEPERYYDTFATVLISGTFLYPVSGREIRKVNLEEDPAMIISKNFTATDILQWFKKQGAVGNKMESVPVTSCFGGLALYRASKYFNDNCSYRHAGDMRYANHADHRPCEHVVFNTCLKEDDHTTVISVQPDLRTRWQNDATSSKLVASKSYALLRLPFSEQRAISKDESHPLSYFSSENEFRKNRPVARTTRHLSEMDELDDAWEYWDRRLEHSISKKAKSSKSEQTPKAPKLERPPKAPKNRRATATTRNLAEMDDLEDVVDYWARHLDDSSSMPGSKKAKSSKSERAPKLQKNRRTTGITHNFAEIDEIDDAADYWARYLDDSSSMPGSKKAKSSKSERAPKVPKKRRTTGITRNLSYVKELDATARFSSQHLERSNSEMFEGVEKRIRKILFSNLHANNAVKQTDYSQPQKSRTAPSTASKPYSSLVHRDTNLSKQNSLVWLMSFPNSGTSYTLRLVGSATGQPVATNYGKETSLAPVFDDSPRGPFWLDESPVPNEGRLILTKTHCGMYCHSCSATRTAREMNEFTAACGTNEDHSQPAYPPTRVKKGIHLIRDPFDNIVSRFHHEVKAGRTDTVQTDRESFRSTCLESNIHHNEQTLATFLSQQQFDIIANVPCRTDFFKYVMWHNKAFEAVEALDIESLPIHYSWYESDLGGTLSKVLTFLETSQRHEPAPFTPGKVYHDYFTPEERDNVKTLFQEVSSTATWAELGRYFK